MTSRLRSGSANARVFDFLETFDGCWYTMGNLRDHMNDRHGIRPRTVDRAVYRLFAEGRVERRVVLVNTDAAALANTWLGVRPVVQFRVESRAYLEAAV